MRFWSDGAFNDQPEEWQPGLVVVPCPTEEWDTACLTVNGVIRELSLRNLGEERAVVAGWARANAGHYHLEARWGSNSTAVTWRLHPAKLTSLAFSTLLDDLQNNLPASLALTLKELGALVGIELVPPRESTVAAELARLRRAVRGGSGHSGLVALLLGLADNPHRVLATRAILRRFEQARRPHGSNRHSLLQARERHRRGEPGYVLDGRVETSVDAPENRLVKLYVHQVQRRLKRLETYTAFLDATRVSEVTALQRQLQIARRQAQFLDNVTLPTFTPQQVTMVFLNVPLYRAALTEFLAFNRSLKAHFNDPALETPFENVPKLYEVWGTLRVIDAVLQVAKVKGYRVRRESLYHRSSDGLVLKTFPSNRALLEFDAPLGEVQVRVYVQPNYNKSSILQSLSFPQIPDVVIEYTTSKLRRLAIFDPKYKLDGELLSTDGRFSTQSRPKKVDIDKMHAYRDAIRDSTGRHVVDYAAILYPGPNERYDRGLEAINANPQESERLAEKLSQTIKGFLDC